MNRKRIHNMITSGRPWLISQWVPIAATSRNISNDSKLRRKVGCSFASRYLLDASSTWRGIEIAFTFPFQFLVRAGNAVLDDFGGGDPRSASSSLQRDSR